MAARRRAHGEGTIYKRASDGRWAASVDLGYRPDGTRNRPTVTAKTQKEVAAKLAALKAKHALDVDETTMTVAEWLERWMARRVEGRLAASTIKGYRTHIDAHLVPHLGRIKLANLRPRDIVDMLDALDDAGLSPTTRLHAFRVLSPALRAAMVEGRIASNPALLVDPPRGSGEVHGALTQAQAEAVLAADDDPLEYLRDVVALRLGARQGEALGLNWADVHLDDDAGPWVNLHQVAERVKGGPPRIREGLKGSRPGRPVSRAVVLLPAVAAAFEAIPAGERHGLVFGTGAVPEKGDRDARGWAARLQRAGVPHQPLHGARATTDGWLTSLGFSPRFVADYLGHKHIATTETHYHRATLEAMRSAVAKA